MWFLKKREKKEIKRDTEAERGIYTHTHIYIYIYIYIYLYNLIYRPTYIISSTGLLRPDIFARPHQEVLVHCCLVHCGLVRCRLKLVLLRILFSDLKGYVFSCVGIHTHTHIYIHRERERERERER